MFEHDDGLQIGMNIDGADMAEFLYDNFRVAMCEIKLSLAKTISQVRRTEILMESVAESVGAEEEDDEFNEDTLVSIRLALLHMVAFNRNLVGIEYEGLDKKPW